MCGQSNRLYVSMLQLSFFLNRVPIDTLGVWCRHGGCTSHRSRCRWYHHVPFPGSCRVTRSITLQVARSACPPQGDAREVARRGRGGQTETERAVPYSGHLNVLRGGLGVQQRQAVEAGATAGRRYERARKQVGGVSGSEGFLPYSLECWASCTQ